MSRVPAIVALLAASLAAEGRAAAPPVALGGPEIVKLDWGIAGLVAADLDGSGRTDLAVMDNDRSTIELLYQIKPGSPPDPAKPTRPNRWEPVLDDARFRRVSVTTGVTMFDLAVGDLEGHGRADLVYTGEPQALTIRYQQADGTWLEKRISDAPAPVRELGSLAIADLGGKGRKDLVMLGRQEIAIFHQQADGTLGPPDRLPLADENCFGLQVCDVNGDGRPDLVYLARGNRDILRVRLQNAAGQFGPELAFPLKPAESTLQVLREAGPKGPAEFVYARERTGQLEFFSLAPAPADDPAVALRPRVFATSAAAAKTAPSAYAFGDFDGDGQEDVAVSDPDGAQMYVYFRQPDGGFTTAAKFPTMSDVRSLAAADWTGTGRASLFAVSDKEQLLAVSTVDANGALGYPQPLALTGRPLAVAAGDLTGNRRVSVVALVEDKGQRSIAILERQPDGTAKTVRSIPLVGLKTDPRAVRLVDANQDGLMDIAVFTPLDAMRLYVQDRKGNFTDAAENPAFHKSYVDNLEVGALAMGDFPGDGKMLVSGGAFARRLKLDAKGALTVVDQFNARDPSADITAAFALPADAGARPDVLLYDRKDEQFERLKANHAGVYEVTDLSPAGRIDAIGAEVRRARPGGPPELFLLGKNRFWWVPLGQPGFVTHADDSYTTDLPEASYGDVTAGNLASDGQLQLVAVDPIQNLVEILGRDPVAKTWTSRMHFKVFETDQHFQGRKDSGGEPRETVIADVTGDGKNDLILLVHDRILIYPQQ